MTESDIGRVISRFGAELILQTATGEHLRCTTRRKLEHVACGDYVRWQQEAQGNAAVTEILPRKNVLSRPDFRGRIKAIAANIDLLMVVFSWRPSPDWEMLDRYLVAASQLPAEVIILMNKADLRAQYASAEQLAALAEYEQAGYQVLHTDAVSGLGIDRLFAALGQRTAVLAGPSGVGKSSLTACLLPDTEIRVGSIGETGEGRHTTTVATLYPVADGVLIDSPGVRDFALPAMNLADFTAAFPEFHAYAGDCRFHNCSHQHEPGCAVKAAFNDGLLPGQRYQRYLALLKRQSNY